MGVLLADLELDVVAQGDLGVSPPEETGSTFAENALLKARYASSETGLPAIADDSGLVVAALDGRPGVYSARYAGEGATDTENVDKLLRELGDRDDRAAFFHCAMSFVRRGDDPAPLLTEASWHGRIAKERRGEGGFGYDPVFFVPDAQCHSAELDAADKNQRSHRGQALRQLLALLRDEYRNEYLGS